MPAAEAEASRLGASHARAATIVLLTTLTLLLAPSMPGALSQLRSAAAGEPLGGHVLAVATSASAAAPAAAPASSSALPSVSAAQAALDCWARGAWVRRRRHGARGALPWWEPSGTCSPPLPGYTPEALCGALAGRRLLLLGDSLSVFMHEELVRALALRPRQQAPARIDCGDYPGSRGPHHQPACRALSLACAAGGALVAYVRTDLLNFSCASRSWRAPPVNVLEHPVGAAFAQIAPTHVLLNRGAHFQPDGAYARGWAAALDYVARAAPNARVLVRNTPAGHPGCVNATGPLAAPARVAAWPFTWSHFPRQNSLLRNLTVRRAGLLYLDAATPTLLRPDGHMNSGRDCLHYGFEAGNAVETWVRLLVGAMGLAPARGAGTRQGGPAGGHRGGGGSPGPHGNGPESREGGEGG